MKVSDLVQQDRPREKAMRFGVSSLSNREFLAILIRCGYKGCSALQVADALLGEAKGLLNLYALQEEEMTKVKGISRIKAIELLCCFEITKRIAYERVSSLEHVDNPKILSEYLNKKIGFKKQEKFHVLFLNIKNQIIHEKTLFIGTLNMSVVHPRDIFKEAIQKNAAKIVVSHNHPSSDCIPSKSDVEVTKTILEVGKIIGIPLMDHLIVSHNKFFSFKEHNLM